MTIIISRDQTDKIFDELKLDDSKYDRLQFHFGVNVELEHGNENGFTNVTNSDLMVTGKIALAHLNEIPNYYDYLLEDEDAYETLAKKIIIITGGTNGLGYAIAKDLSKIGKVIITGRSQENVSRVSAELKCEGICVDVTDYDKSKSEIQKVISKYGKIDILINNAGILYEGMINELSDSQISELIDINVKGVEYMTNIVSPYMIDKRSGQIINIISQSGLYHRRDRSLYNSSKWAITGFTKCVSVDLARFGIRVSGFYPGKMDTNIFKNTTIDSADKSLSLKTVVKGIRFLIEAPEDVVITELGMKSINQQLVDEICY